MQLQYEYEWICTLSASTLRISKEILKMQTVISLLLSSLPRLSGKNRSANAGLRVTVTEVHEFVFQST